MRQRWAMLGARLALLVMLPGLSCVGVDREEDFEEAFHALEIGPLSASLDGRVVRKHMDLTDPTVSRLMREKMETFPPERGKPLPDPVMGCILWCDSQMGLTWLLDSFPDFSLGGRVNTLKSLRHLDARESYSLLIAFLADSTPVYEKPPGPGASYLRVCDYAYNSLRYLLRKRVSNKELPRRILDSYPVQKRDTILSRFKEWWAESGPKILAEKPSVAPPGSKLHEKLTAFLESLQTGGTPE